MNVSHNGTAYFPPGTHTFGMAARFDVGIASTAIGNVTTTIRWHNYLAEFATGG